MVRDNNLTMQKIISHPLTHIRSVGSTLVSCSRSGRPGSEDGGLEGEGEGLKHRGSRYRGEPWELHTSKDVLQLSPRYTFLITKTFSMIIRRASSGHSWGSLIFAKQRRVSEVLDTEWCRTRSRIDRRGRFCWRCMTDTSSESCHFPGGVESNVTGILSWRWVWL